MITVLTPLLARPEDAGLRYRILFVQRSRDGNQIPGVDDRIELPLNPEAYARLARDGVVYRREIARDPRAMDLRIVVVDLQSALIGSLTVPFGRLK